MKMHKGKDGKEYANPQVMRHKDKMGGGGAAPKASTGEQPQMAEDKPDADEGSGAPAMLEQMHSKMGGKHMHVHQGDDGKITSHQHSDMGAEGPHEHADKEALKAHMDEFMDGEGDGMGGMPMGGMHHMMGSGY